MINNFVPESVRDQLMVGVSVRYVPVVMCSHVPGPLAYSSKYGAVNHESYTDAENKIGVIIEINNQSYKAGHPYHVKMEEPYRFGGLLWDYILVAAYELVLVEN